MFLLIFSKHVIIKRKDRGISMLKRDLLRNIIIILIIALILIVLRIFIYTPYKVTKADANSYFSENDLIVATNKDNIQYGDFVLYEMDGKEYVSRVIAKGGDKAVYMDNLLYLNDKVKPEAYIEKMKEKYLASAASTGYYTHDFSVMDLKNASSEKVTKNHYLVLNDRRENTKDSREFGLISAENIKGVVDFRLLPLNQFGFVKVE